MPPSLVPYGHGSSASGPVPSGVGVISAEEPNFTTNIVGDNGHRSIEQSQRTAQHLAKPLDSAMPTDTGKAIGYIGETFGEGIGSTHTPGATRRQAVTRGAYGNKVVVIPEG